MSKSVCILRSNPVRPDSRVEKEAFILAKNGYEVCIFAWDRDSNHKEVRELITVGGYDIPIYRVGYRAAFGAGFKSLKPYLKFQYSMRHFLRKNHFDAVHACDFDTAFFTYQLVKRQNEKFIFDIFDILGDDERTLFQKLLKKVQIDIVNSSDATIICTEERMKQIEKGHPKRLEVIHNTPFVQQLSGLQMIQKSSKPISVCYVGILQNGRLLKEIGAYFSEHPELEFRVGGFGYLEPYFEELSENFQNIKYYGRLPYQETLSLERDSDIMLAIYDPSISNHRFAAPNKFYEALFLGKPLVMVKGTGMSQIIEKYDIGELIEYNKKGFEKGLLHLIERKGEWSKMSIRMKKVYDNDYSGLEMEKRLRRLYEGIFQE